MEVQDHGAMGQTVLLEPPDRLTAVPKSFRGLITDEIRSVFRDVPGYFARLAQRSPFPQMAEWLNTCLRVNRWQLVLNQSLSDGRAGFRWCTFGSGLATGAEIGLPERIETQRFPKPLARLFELVGYVDFAGYFEGGGRINPPEQILALRHIDPAWYANGPHVDWEQTVAWGGFNGAHLFATPDDRGGWISTGSKVTLGGSVTETVNWWFGRLLANTTPTCEAFEEAYGHHLRTS
jgi:hypothetical protein